MKGKYTTWIMLLLLLALIGLTAWMFWAIQKIEGNRGPVRRISMIAPYRPDHQYRAGL